MSITAGDKLLESELLSTGTTVLLQPLLELGLVVPSALHGSFTQVRYGALGLSGFVSHGKVSCLGAMSGEGSSGLADAAFQGLE